jgi:citrate synthase
LCGVGNVFAGGSEQIAKVLQEALPHAGVQPDLQVIARRIVDEYAARKQSIRGIGHPLHKPIDPRTPMLFSIAPQNGFRRHISRFSRLSAEAG